VSTLGTVHLPSRRLGPLAAILVRVAVAVLCILAVTLLVYLEREGYRDVCREVDRCVGKDAEISFLDALYYSTVSLSTTGYGDITPITEQTRLVNVFVITPIRVLFLIVLIGTTVEVLTQRSRDEYRTRRWRERVRDHTVIIGFGVKGRSALEAILDQGTPAQDVVVVTNKPTEVEEATAFGVLTISGDATREEVLRSARVETAAKVVIATDRDDTTVLVALTVGRLNPGATVVASARESQNISLIKSSGVGIVIPTAESAGRMLGLSLTSPRAGQMVEDLLEPQHGLEIVERDITPAELGLSPESLLSQGDMVLGVVRGGELYRFDERRATVLQRGDRIVVIRPTVNGT
jgi:voltage-gated potassium channel